MNFKPLANEKELRCSIEWIARMYVTEEREANESAWPPEARAEMADQTRHVRLKIEHEVAEFLARKYGYIAQSANAMIDEPVAEEITAREQNAPAMPVEQAA